MNFSGERFVPELNDSYISYEHWHRYFFASEFVKSKMVLDIACGEGYGSFVLSHAAERVVGVDISEQAIHHASSRYLKGNLSFLHGSVAQIPVPEEGVFDVIVSFETIEHVGPADQEAFLREVKRLLKPGGLFLVSSPNKLVYQNVQQQNNPYHQREFYVDEFQQFLQGYFKNLALLGQKVYPVSYIWPLQENTGRVTEHRIRLTDSGFVPTQEEKEALYIVAACSDAALPEMGPFFEVDLSNQMGAEKEQVERRLQAQLDQVKNSVQAQLEAQQAVYQAEMEKQREDTEMTLMHLRARVSDRDRTISSLSSRLANEEQNTRNLLGQLHNLQLVHEETARTLALIISSTGWKMVRVLWAVRLFLFPHGSRREALGHWASDIVHGHRKITDLFKRKPAPPEPVEEMPGNGRLGGAEGEASSQGMATIIEGSPAHRENYSAMLAAAGRAKTTDYVDLSQDEFSTRQSPVKLIAFYLPQFHPIPENDAWWGKGFTEWRNVAKAVPQFLGQYQPHLPGELGFYDLRVPEVQQRQVELARKYGIFGFCFYYYWFNGKRVLERPLDAYVANPAIDFPFCICWANENWTRTWDGMDNEILLAQNHSEESDIAFIQDIMPLLQNPNYIKVDGRPLLMIYRVTLLPNPAETAKRWKMLCKRAGVPEPFLVMGRVFGLTQDPQDFGFDAAVEFPPHNINLGENALQPINDRLEILNSDYQGTIFDYKDIVKAWANEFQPGVFHTVFPSWDNEARKPGFGTSFAFASPALYAEWLKKACLQALKHTDEDKRLVFVNAWNEWAEGAHLEPDQRFGYGYLQATADTLMSLRKERSQDINPWTILFVTHDTAKGGAQAVLLDVIHWFKRYTAVRLKVLALQGGEWLPRFEARADVLVWDGEDLETGAALERLRNFCGGPPDVVYGNTVASGRIYPLLTMLGAPLVTHVHELENSIRRYALDWIGDIVRLTTRFIACSPAVAENLIQNHQVDPAVVETVYASIQPDPLFDPHTFEANQKRRLREKLRLPQDKVLVIGSGLGMPYRKGADLFIETARVLKLRGYRNFHFAWVGAFDENERDANGRTWADWLGRIHAEELTGFVSFLGVKENPRDYFRAGDIFLLPSREDPFPLVALEAAECLLPVICFAGSGGMPGFVGEDAGLIAPWEDVESLADKVITLLESEAARQKMGRAAREKVLRFYSVEATTPHILSLCRRVAGKQPTVSVIVPNYNHEKYLPRRLDSIFNQTFRDVEVLLLDDASTDRSLDVLKEYAHRADVQILPNENNTGSPFKQWMKGMDRAAAEIVWIAESDDMSEPEFLDALLPSMSDPRVKLAYCNSFVIDENDVVIGDYTETEYLTSLSKTKWKGDYQVSAQQEINDGLGVKNTILNISAVLLRKSHLDAEGREALIGMRIAGDWYYIIRAIQDGEVRYTARKLNYHRRHSASVIGQTVSDKRTQAFFREFAVVQRYILENYPLDEAFPAMWEAYLRQQWRDFYPERDFKELNEFYPFEEMRSLLPAMRQS